MTSERTITPEPGGSLNSGAPLGRGAKASHGVSPIAAVGVPALYTLIALDGERRRVLACFVAGAIVNLGVGAGLSGSLGVHGVLIGCAAGTALTSAMLLARLATVLVALQLESA